MKKRAIIPGLTTKGKIWITLLPILGLTLAVLGALVGVCTDWQMLADEAKARDFKPSASIENIANELQLTRKGKSIFYATHPQLQTSAQFNLRCGSDGDTTYTLGCYYQDKDEEKTEHIAIYNSGVLTLDENGYHYDFAADRSTTALHEMLHAVYDRLEIAEKAMACWDASTIADEVPSLADSLRIYSNAQYCTEAYARIGSEYIIALSGYNRPTALADRDMLSVEAKQAADRMVEHYQKYFSFNYKVAEAHYSNILTKLSLSNLVTALSDNLASERVYVQAMIDGYYYYPTFYNYISTNNAIDSYNSHLASFKNFYSTFAKIYDVLDSETDATLASL